MGEAIVFTSGKGGVGKTTTIANIGAGLSRLDKKVIMLDTDMGLRNLDVVMGMEDQIQYNLIDLLENKCRLKQALIRDKRYPNLFMIPAALRCRKIMDYESKLYTLISHLKQEFDFCLIDCPAGIEDGFHFAVSAADRAVVVTSPHISAVRDAGRVICLLDGMRLSQIDLLINAYNARMVRKHDMLSQKDVEDILGPELFDYGYGPFRWCCLSGKPEDLRKTDHAAMEIIDPNRRSQDRDNYIWIRDAEKNKLVVGTQCRILYQDALGRRDIALKFNEMVRNGEIGPVMLGRDHHDTGGTDSPYRETSNIYDGSNITADMAVHCYAGNAARGMSLVALHNGGGVGISKSINGGFGMVLDGSERVDEILMAAIPWDTMIGVSRRSWGRCEHSIETVAEYNRIRNGEDYVTMPYLASDELIERVCKDVVVEEHHHAHH